MIHTLEGFCRWLYPLQDENGIYARIYWLSSLSFQKKKQKCYRRLQIPKSNGGFRTLDIPSQSLQQVQRGIMKLISQGIISPCATAYRSGISTLQNAAPHQGKPLVVKVDLSNFFESISFSQVFWAIDKALSYSPTVGRHFHASSCNDRDDRCYNQVLSFFFTQFCTLNGSLPQGAPSSPILSNLVMEPLDSVIQSYCHKRQICYTRYCDDLTFSGDFEPGALLVFLRRLLKQNGFQLNEYKTKVLRQNTRQQITGITVNQRPQVCAPYRRQIRQQCYYLHKFGLEDQLARYPEYSSGIQYLQSLLGKVEYILSIHPQDSFFSDQSQQIRLLIKHLSTSSSQS